MSLFQLNVKPSDAELRWFAGLWFPAFCATIAWPLVRRTPVPVAALTIFGLAAGLLSLATWSPAVVRLVYSLSMRIALPIGWVVSYVILTVAYFAFITPAGLVMRLFHDPLTRTFERSAPSYWTRVENSERTRYFRQT